MRRRLLIGGNEKLMKSAGVIFARKEYVIWDSKTNKG
jgi:hypothetical protein